MYFPKSEVTLTIAETTFVTNAISIFVNNNEVSEEFKQGMMRLLNSCKNLWTEDEWEVYLYMHHLNDWRNKSLIDRRSDWKISIVDCDSIILALQFMYMSQSKKAIEGDSKADDYANSIKDVMIPRFSNMFSKNEWGYYFSETNGDMKELDVDELHIEDTIEFDSQDTVELN
jgi:hypothetical protein